MGLQLSTQSEVQPTAMCLNLDIETLAGDAELSLRIHFTT